MKGPATNSPFINNEIVEAFPSKTAAICVQIPKYCEKGILKIVLSTDLSFVPSPLISKTRSLFWSINNRHTSLLSVAGPHIPPRNCFVLFTLVNLAHISTVKAF